MADDKLPADTIERSPVITPGTRITPVSPAAGMSGTFPYGKPGSPANPGTTGRANVTDGSQEPTVYDKLTADQQPPNTISEVNIGRNWFSPMQPIAPFGPPYVTYPRAFDYQTGWNIDFLPARFTLYQSLRAMSQGWGLLRSVIETRKDQLLRQPWEIRLRDQDKKKKTESVPKRVQQLRDFFRKPDGKRRFDPWARLILEDRFVIDAASLYIWRAAGGAPLAAEVVDGATIHPLIDDAGRIPSYPSPSYQQIIKGLPMINLDETEILYAPARPRPQSPRFGYSEVEQIMLEIMEGIRKTLYKVNFWNEGTLPDLIVTVPDGWTPAQVAQFQAAFDAMMSGNLAFKSKVRFMPGGMKPFDIKNANGEGLKTDEDEWLARIVCFTFSISPTPFIRQMNRATADTAKEQAEEEGLHPLMTWFKSEVMDPIIQEDIGFGFDDCEFAWTQEPETDPLVEMQVLTGYVKAGVRTPNEAREILGDSPVDGGDELIVETASGPVPLKESVEAARQQALAKPDELQRQQETHDKSMAEPAQPKGKPGVGKLANTPFVYKKGKRYRRMLAPSPDRPAAQKITARAQKKIAATLRALGKSVAKQLRAYSKVAKAKADKTDEIVADLSLADLQDMVDQLQPELESIAQDTAYEVLASVGLEDDQAIVDVVNEQAVEFARERAAELVGMRYNQDGDLVEAVRAEFRIDDTTRDMLRDSIADGLKDNLGLDQIADNIQNDFAFSEDRAQTIAYTEVARANSQSSLDSMRTARDAGVDTLKSWETASDPCPICIENEDAGDIALDDDFPSGDDAPPAHPWCYCALGVVVNEDDVEQMAKRRGRASPFTCEVISKATNKSSKRMAGYVATSPHDNERCGLCTMFRKPDSCTAVSGTISPRAWCRFFEKGDGT